MKIIHLVLGKGNPERMNGVNKVAYQLATTQTNLAYNVELWGIANTLEHNYPERNFKTVLFQQYRNPFCLSASLKQAIQGLSSNNIVHIHGSFIPQFYRIARLLEQKNIPFVYTPHGALTEGAMSKNKTLKKIYFRFLESFIIRQAKAVQLLGEQEKSYLQTLIETNNVCLIPNGQDFNSIPYLPAKNYNPKELVFGFCGRLAIFHKGLDLTLHAFKLHIEQGYSARLELIGDSDERMELEQLSKKLGIDQLVTFHGAKFGKEKFELINQFDVFLHTSRMEGFPTAVLEAAALAKPCITSEATNINSYFRTHRSGLPLAENTPKAIANMMGYAQQLHQNGELAPIGQAAQDMVKEEFSWKTIALQLLKIYLSKKNKCLQTQK